MTVAKTLHEQIMRKCRQAHADTQSQREKLFMEGSKNLPSPTEAAIHCFLDETGVIEALQFAIADLRGLLESFGERLASETKKVVEGTISDAETALAKARG